MSINQLCSNGGVNTFSPSVSLRELNVKENINFGSDVKVSEPSAGVLQVKSDEFKWSSNDDKDHFRCYADGVFSHFEFTGDDTGGLLCDFKVPSSTNPFDLRIALANPDGNYIQNKGLLLFQDSTGTLAGQELLIRDSAQIGGAGIALPNTTGGYVASTLNYYEEYTNPNQILSGLSSVPTIAIQIVRIGKNVTLSWNDVGLGSGLGNVIQIDDIPDRFRPLASRMISVPVVNNNLHATGCVQVLTTGFIVFSGSDTPNSVFTNGQPAQIFGGSISYNVV